MGNTSKKTLKPLIAMCIIIAMIYATVNTVKASTGPGIYASPSEITLPEGTPLGHKFNVTGYIANITSDRPAFTWQVQMFWDLTQLNVTRARYTGTAGVMSEFFEGHITTSPGASINYATGYVLIAETLLGNDTAYTGEGVSKSLFWVEFTVTATPSDGPLHSIIDVSTGYDLRTWVKDTDLAKIPLELANADYVYIPEFAPILGLLAVIVLTTFVIAIKGKLKPLY